MSFFNILVLPLLYEDEDEHMDRFLNSKVLPEVSNQLTCYSLSYNKLLRRMYIARYGLHAENLSISVNEKDEETYAIWHDEVKVDDIFFNKICIFTRRRAKNGVETHIY